MPDDVRPTDDSDGHAGRFPVLDVFGVKLKVTNSRLAELLTMDAKQALTTDVRILAKSDTVRDVCEETVEAVPGVILTPMTPHDEHAARERREFRRAVAELGVSLGFEPRPDGVWDSPTGITLVTRPVECGVSFAAASHFVSELADRRESIAGSDSCALFVVEGHEAAEVFKVSIRQRKLHHIMRVITLEDLREVATFVGAHLANHRQAVAMLAPLGDIDAGELVAVVRAARGRSAPSQAG